jgi:hypothetical protein
MNAQLSIDFSPRAKVFIPNPYRPGSQKFRLLERLKDGPLTNKEIIEIYHIWNTTGRLSDIRLEVLEPMGLALESVRIKKTLFEYRIKGV